MGLDKPTPVLFVDLDGTIRFNGKDPNGFVNEPANIEVYPGVVDLLKAYKARGWRVVAVSNQGGIAMGFVTENTVNRGMDETRRLCANAFDRMMWCPHHPDADSDEKSKCFCRKPKAGMVLAAIQSMAEQYNEYYRPWTSLFVGDRMDDVKCAEALDIPFLMAVIWRKKTDV